MSKSGTVNIGGNEYKTVALRVYELREEHPDWTLLTKIISNEFSVVMKATLRNEVGITIATGHAQEDYSKDDTNESSALEVCETSAVGRCLAFASWPGSELEFDPNIASADEVSGAIRKEIEKRQGNYMADVFTYWPEITNIKQHIAEERNDAALEEWRELGEDVMIKLWRAPTKGGCFSIAEKKALNDASEAQVAAGIEQTDA